MSDLEKNIPILYGDVCQIIDGTRTRIATTVNAEVCWMNWHIGKRIKEDVLYNKRAESIWRSFLTSADLFAGTK